jgi:hypothetical protein
MLRNKSLGFLAAVDCPNTPAYKRVLCQGHQAIAETTAPAQKIRRIRWKAPLALCAEDLVDVWAENAEGNEQRIPCDAVDVTSVLRFVIQQSVASHQSTRTENADGAAQQDPEPPALPDLDAWTVVELAKLQRTTHKLDLQVKQKRKAKRSRKNSRSGGFIASVTPEGYVTDVCEFMGAESCKQRYMFLAGLKELYPELAVILHDDACHLRRFAQKFAGQNELASSISYPRLKFVLDRFHASGHVDPWCLQNVHPATQENAPLVAGQNTSANEILFAWLARYKHIFRKMNRWTGNFFVQEVMDLHNEAAFPASGSVPEKVESCGSERTGGCAHASGGSSSSTSSSSSSS